MSTFLKKRKFGYFKKVKIPLIKRKILGYERYVVTLNITVKDLKIFGIEALIDTGSPHTILMEKDLRRLRLPYTSLPEAKQMKLGGYTVKLIDIGECILTFKDVNENLVSFKQKVFGGYITKRDVQHFPNILGLDFLDAQKLNFIIDENGNRFLERER